MIKRSPRSRLWERNNGGILYSRFLLKAFAKPKSNISFLSIWQKRALGSAQILDSKTWCAKGVRIKFAASNWFDEVIASEFFHQDPCRAGLRSLRRRLFRRTCGGAEDRGGRLCQATADDGPALHHHFDHREFGNFGLRSGKNSRAASRGGGHWPVVFRADFCLPHAARVSRDGNGFVFQHHACRAAPAV